MGKKAPKAPDPYATAAAQSGLNTDTALTQQLVNMVDQSNPWGSTTYNQTGESSFRDSNGRLITVPRFQQTTTLSPAQQQIFDQTQEAESNLAGLASEQSASLRDYLNKGFEFNNQDAADWAYDLASSRILPQQEQAREQLRTQLINSGLRPGTQAYEREMMRMQQGNTDQMNQLALTARGQAFAEAIAQRNQPLNEVTALLSGSQVSNPASMSGPAPQANVAGVDYAGLVNDQYKAQMQSYQAGMGGLFGLAGSLGSAWIRR